MRVHVCVCVDGGCFQFNLSTYDMYIVITMYSWEGNPNNGKKYAFAYRTSLAVYE